MRGNRAATPDVNDIEFRNPAVLGVSGFTPNQTSYPPGPGSTLKTPTAELVLSGRSFSASLQGLERPGTDVCIWFTIGAGSRSVLGLSGGREFFWYADRFWVRASMYEFYGGSSYRRGLGRLVRGRLHLYLYQVEPLNRPEVYDRAMARLAGLLGF